MSITRLPEIVFPLTQVNKVNEIVDVLNENLNMYYSAENPVLVPTSGIATWTVTHNLGTENVNCSLYNGDMLVLSSISITSDNVVTVSLNSDVAIAEGTYKIVIISNGSGSSSGSGSYVLPTASTTTLGGVRIDGSSITINNGVISTKSVDSALNSTSENPVQNKVIYPSLSNFLPAGTNISVELDGSGDFTSLGDAINYLIGKWSNGFVYITLGTGTFTLTSGIRINTSLFNFSRLIIKGTSKTDSILYRSTWSGRWDSLLIVEQGSTPVHIQDMTIKGVRQDGVLDAIGVWSQDNANVTLSNVHVQDFTTGVSSYSSGCLTIGSVSLNNLLKGLVAQGARTSILLGRTITASSVGTVIAVVECGFMQVPRVTFSETSVNNRYSQNKNTITNDGIILVG